MEEYSVCPYCDGDMTWMRNGYECHNPYCANFCLDGKYNVEEEED